MVLQGPEGQGPFVDESVTGEGRDRLAIPITQADLIEKVKRASILLGRRGNSHKVPQGLRQGHIRLGS